MKIDTNGLRKRLLSVLNQKRQVWWAKKTGQTQPAVGKWFKDSYPRPDKLLKIMQLSDISANWLFFKIGPKRLSDIDDAEIEQGQEQGRESQMQMLKMAKENVRLRERVEDLEREISQNTIDWLFKGVENKDTDSGEKETIFNYNVFPILALMRQINDISFKVLEGYVKNSVDDKEYRQIADYIKKNYHKNNFDLKKMLVELDDIIK